MMAKIRYFSSQFSPRFFPENLFLCMVSIQEQFVIKRKWCLAQEWFKTNPLVTWFNLKFKFLNLFFPMHTFMPKDMCYSHFVYHMHNRVCTCLRAILCTRNQALRASLGSRIRDMEADLIYWWTFRLLRIYVFW